MLERREAILQDKLVAATERLTSAKENYENVLKELQHLQAVRGAGAGDWLDYRVQGKDGGGHIIGIDGETFILMSGPVHDRNIRRVNARHITGVRNGAAET